MWQVVTLALVRGRGTGGPNRIQGPSLGRGQCRGCGEGKAEGDPSEGGRKKDDLPGWVSKGTGKRGLAQAPVG